MDARLAFVTIGQTPRTDVVPEMTAWLGEAVEIVEYGALDGLSRIEVDALSPAGDEHRLVTRLADGSEAVVAKEAVRQRLQELLADMPSGAHAAVVLLCTGHLTGLRTPGLLVESQVIVDHAVSALAWGARSLGILVPLERQMREIHFPGREGQRLLMSHASPYRPERLEEAARELADADLVILHCMGYTEAMRRTVATVTGRPVLLARRLVASAVAQLL